MHISKSIILALAILTFSSWAEAATIATSNGSNLSDKQSSVDQIKGLGKFKFGEKLSDFPPGSLQIVDPKATGVLLRVSPYGDNYLFTDLTGLTWGTIPITGLVLTFHDNVLIDFQLALKATKGDLYLADRAFNDKYGSCDPHADPVETWSGSKIQVTIVFADLKGLYTGPIDAPAQGKVEMFDQALWNKFEAAHTAKLKEMLDQRYQTANKKVKANL